MDAKRLERARPVALEAYWLRAFKQAAGRALEISPFYRRRWKKLGGALARLKDFAGLQDLPLTTKEALRKHNRDFFALPEEKWADVFATGGTTGEPIYFPQSAQDLERTARAEERSLSISGVKRSDVVLLQMPMHGALWGAGLSYYLGYQRIGACVLRTGPGQMGYQAQVLRQLKPTVIHSNVGFLLAMARAIPEKERRCVRLLIAGLDNTLDEGLKRNVLGQQLQRAWPWAQVSAVYGMTESASPWHECPEGLGYHITPEFCVVEIVDPRTFRHLPAGEPGVMVITPLGVEGLPLLRYLLGDVSRLVTEPCACGRRWRLGAVVGRIDQQLKIKGVTLYPQAIETLVKSVPGVADYYLEVTRQNGLDRLAVVIAAGGDDPQIAARVTTLLQERLHVKPKVYVKSEQTVRQRVFAGTKPRRFFDRRGER